MTLYDIGEVERENIFFLCGITGSQYMVLEDFANELSKNLKSSKQPKVWVDDRLKEENTESFLSLAQIARAALTDIINKAVAGEPIHIIAYSFSCLLCPYIQYLADKAKIEIIFTLIDQPSLTVLHAQSTQSKIDHIADIFFRIAALLKLEPTRPNKEQINELSELAVKMGGVHDNGLLNRIFNEVVPTFQEKLKEARTDSSDPGRKIKLQQIPKITRLNIAAMYSPVSTEFTATLTNTLLVSTPSTMIQFGCQTKDLGWGSDFESSNNNKITHLSSPPDCNHFSIVNPTNFSHGGCDILITAIIEHHQIGRSISTPTATSRDTPDLADRMSDEDDVKITCNQIYTEMKNYLQKLNQSNETTPVKDGEILRLIEFVMENLSKIQRTKTDAQSTINQLKQTSSGQQMFNQRQKKFRGSGSSALIEDHSTAKNTALTKDSGRREPALPKIPFYNAPKLRK